MATDCYVLTKGFPEDEAFGMTAQIRRVAVSVAANIAEGHGREARGSFIHSLRISQGSLKELETHLAGRVGTAAAAAAELILDRCEALGEMLRRLIRSLQKNSSAARDATAG